MTDNHFKRIYAEQAADYDALVSAEDHQGNILTALQEICVLEGATVVELGAGTGRLTRLLAPHVQHIHAFDGAPAMLVQARLRLALMADNWSVGVADNAHTPIPENTADIVIAGWSLGHATGWYPDDWPARIDRVLVNMLRIVNKQGTVIILETMGTGVSSPAAPTPSLAAYYDRLETQYQFNHKAIDTDFKFASVDEATRLISFFFGEVMAARIPLNQMTTFPEWTGVWWRAGT